MNLKKLLSVFKNDEYISIANIQRKMGVGYITAAKYLVNLIDKKYVYKNDKGKYVFNRKTDDWGINLVFLDVDGVLNCADTEDMCGRYIGIEDQKVELLKKLVEETNSRIILVSTWKFFWYKDPYLKDKQDELANYLDEKMVKQGLTIYDKTEDIDVLNRGQGIIEYLRKLRLYGIRVHRYVILDDESFDYLETKLTKHLVATSYKYGGLEEKHIKKALEKMNN